MKSRKILLLLAILILSGAVCCCEGPRRYRTAGGGMWNTVYHITYCSDTDLDDSIISVMKEIENSLSPFARMSLISKINRGEDAKADTMLRLVFAESKRVHRLSGGVFDPTVSPLINLWGFGYKPGDDEPAQAAIDSLLPLVGIDSCAILADGAVVKKHPLTEFNFSAITKGYGCDMVGDMLRRNGVDNYMVEIGGEIAAAGRSPRGAAWRIMIDAPVESDSAPVHQGLAMISVTDRGIATSGNYRNYRETGNGRAWHTISPSSGRPALTNLLSATVIAPTCMTADALATSCMAMRADSALAMIERIPEAEALLVTADSVLVSSGFPELSGL